MKTKRRTRRRTGRNGARDVRTKQASERDGGGPWQSLVQLLSAVTLSRKASTIIYTHAHTHTHTHTL